MMNTFLCWGPVLPIEAVTGLPEKPVAGEEAGGRGQVPHPAGDLGQGGVLQRGSKRRSSSMFTRLMTFPPENFISSSNTGLVLPVTSFSPLTWS